MASVRVQNLPDQEKLELSMAPLEHRQHNVAPSQKTAMPRWRSKGKEKSTVALACTWIVDHQISIALNVLGILFFTHAFFPHARHHTQKFFRISYFNPATGTFALGWDDIFFVFYWIIVFTGLRCIFMDYILNPVAGWCGIRKKKAKVRFAEQAWIMLYYAMFWSVGMYIMYKSDYWFNLRNLWRNWPIREMEGLAKWYYLVQFAFWLQQIVVVNIEERRKDHWQMFTHHIVTCTLVFASYGYHQSKVGNVILCLMDVVDLFLPAAKILKYLGYKLPCDIMFGVFMITWLVARHALYMTVWYSIYAHIPEEINYGCYYGSKQNLKGPVPVPNDWDHLIQPFKDPEGLVCWNTNIKWAFLLMLLALQGIIIMWFVMIVKVAYKVITGQGAEDVRSDDEDDEDEEEEEQLSQKKSANDAFKKSNQMVTEVLDQIQPCVESPSSIEEEVLSTDSRAFTQSKMKSRSPTRRSLRKMDGTGANSSGINVRGKSDRKELLGRIGCDKSGSE